MEKENENKRVEVKAFVARDRNGELYFYTQERRVQGMHNFGERVAWTGT